jgi:alpha-L-rhamnosidase
MFSAVIGWFFKSLLGIRVDINNPGFNSVEFTPCFIKEVGYAKGRVDVRQGSIEIEWKYENNGYVYSVCLPEGIDATFRGEKLKSGKNSFFVEE